MSREAPPPYFGDTGLWAENLSDYLQRSRSSIPQLTSQDKAAQDGIFLWDAAGYPVVSKNGEFRQIVLADGHGDFVINSDVSFTAGVATELTWSVAGALEGMSLSGNDIILEEAGHYMASFSAQIYSTSGSTVNFVFWSELNGTPGNTMRNALHQNGAALVVSRTVVFNAPANAALTAFAAVDGTAGQLKSFPANEVATEPASPSATLSVFRLHQ